MDVLVASEYRSVITNITRLNWESLDRPALTRVAVAYYYFSIQFRENLETTIALYPEDEKLADLKSEECDTDNLSPWPGVAAAGERVNHDEFMRRLLSLCPLDPTEREMLDAVGESYLADVRSHTPLAKAMSIASYEDGGLEVTFQAMLRAPDWNDPLLQAFAHFLRQHIQFDSNPDQGHGALSRHIAPDDRVLPLWQSFYDILVTAAPELMA